MIDERKPINVRLNNTSKIYAIGDVHYGALEHCKKEWESFLQRILNEDDSYVILCGDLINNSIKTCKFANPFDEIVRPREQKERMVEFLKPLVEKGKIIGAVSGNHENRNANPTDQDLTYDIMARLGIEDLYRPNVAVIRASLGKRNSENSPIATYNIVVTHGNGGGSTTGAMINKNEKYASVYEGIDALITGHYHKGAITMPSRRMITPARIIDRPVVCVSAVSWLSYGGYAARAMLAPSTIAIPNAIVLKMQKKKSIKVEWGED